MGVYLSTPIRDKISEDAETIQLRYGASSMQGWRTSQEDAHNCCPRFDPENNTSLFACYDGHGGAEVAQYTAQHFPDFLKNLATYKENDLKKALEDAFLSFDATLKEDAIIQKLKELAGVDDDDESEGNQEEPNALYEEATMPLEELLSRYGRGGVTAVNALKKDQHFQSPAITAHQKNSNAKPMVRDDVRMKLENELMNGHSDNENNENIERASQIQAAMPSCTAPSSSGSSSAAPSRSTSVIVSPTTTTQANEAQAKEENDTKPSLERDGSIQGSSCVDSTTSDDASHREAAACKVKAESDSNLPQPSAAHTEPSAAASSSGGCGEGDAESTSTITTSKAKRTTSDSSVNGTDSQPSSTTTSFTAARREEPGSSSSMVAGKNSAVSAESSSAVSTRSSVMAGSSTVSAGSSSAVSAGSSSAVSTGSSSAVSAGSSAVSEGSSATVSAESSSTVSAGSSSTVSAGSSSTVSAGSSSTVSSGSSSSVSSGSLSSVSAGSSSSVSAGTSSSVSAGTLSSVNAGSSSSVSTGTSSSSQPVQCVAPESSSSSAGGSSGNAGGSGTVSNDEVGPCSSSKQEPEAGSSTGRTRSKRKNVIPEEGEDESSFDEDSSDDEDDEDEEGAEPWASGSGDSSDEDAIPGPGDEEDEEDEEEEEDEAMSGGEEPGADSGCTSVVALLRGKELYVANAGDSRCVLCRGGKAHDMSIDHKPEDELEHSRITKAGGRVTMDGRVNGGLNLSRAIGDHCYKRNSTLSDKEQMITALPDVKTATLEETDTFMVLACDGIWNVMTSQDVVNFVSERLKGGVTKLSSICEEMFDFCLSPDTSGDGTGCDNMTCMIVCFKHTDGQTEAVAESTSVKRLAESTDKSDLPESKRARTEAS